MGWSVELFFFLYAHQSTKCLFAHLPFYTNQKYRILEGGTCKTSSDLRTAVFCRLLPSSASCRFMTSSAGERGILIGRFTVNHRQFGVTHRRSRSVRQNKCRRSNRASVRFFLKSKDRHVVLKPEQDCEQSTKRWRRPGCSACWLWEKHDFYSLQNGRERENGRSSCVLLICPLKSIVSDQIAQLEGLCAAVEFTAENVSKMAPPIANFAFSGFFHDKNTHKPPASRLQSALKLQISVLWTAKISLWVNIHGRQNMSKKKRRTWKSKLLEVLKHREFSGF